MSQNKEYIKIPILPTSEESEKMVDELINKSQKNVAKYFKEELMSEAEQKIYQKGMTAGANKERKYIMEYITSWPNFPDKKADANLYCAISDLLSKAEKDFVSPYCKDEYEY